MNSHSLTTVNQRFCSSIPCRRNPSKPYKPYFVGFPSTICSIPTLAAPSLTASVNGATSFPFRIFSSSPNRARASSGETHSIADGRSNEMREPSFAEFITSERVKVVAMLALALALCNADRVVMSVVVVPLSLSRGWRQSFGGIVQVRLNLSSLYVVLI